MNIDYTKLGEMAIVAVIASIIVLLAMAIDLVSGLYKAKQRGGNDEAYTEMQDWRDKAGFIARMYAGRQPLEEGK